MYRNQYTVEGTSVSKPVYSWGNQCIETNIKLREPVYLNQYTVVETSVSKPMYSWGNQCI